MRLNGYRWRSNGAVDTTELRDDQDMRCDDMGAWLCTGSRRYEYSVDDMGNINMETELGNQSHKKQYQLNHQFVKNKNASSVTRFTFSEEGEQEIVVQAHRNAKRDAGNAGYKHMMKSTKVLIMEKLTVLPPRKTTRLLKKGVI
jgi:hypothetical protein